MGMPTGIGVIDLMLAIPTDDTGRWYEFMKPLLRDRESREQFKMPAEYMFRNIPGFEPGADMLKLVVGEMDKYGIERAMLNVDDGAEASIRSTCWGAIGRRGPGTPLQTQMGMSSSTAFA